MTSSRGLYAVTGLTGRDITPFSARRDVLELLFLPAAPDPRLHGFFVGDIA